MSQEQGSGGESAGGSGFLDRLRGWARLFRPTPGGAGADLPQDPVDLAFLLVSRSSVLFSVFPDQEESAEDAGDPTRAFCQHLVQVLHRRLGDPTWAPLVGLLGAGGAGKSTLFNDLLGAEYSLVDILPHTTRGPVAVAAPGVELRGLFHPLVHEEGGPGRARGEPRRFVASHFADCPLPGVVLVDLPDLNTRKSKEEGTLTTSLLPWLDVTLVVCSVESFDRTVLDQSLGRLGHLGSSLLLLFNRKGCRGPVADGDLVDIQTRVGELGAEGPYFFPDLRRGARLPDDRERLLLRLRDLGEVYPRGKRLQALRDSTVRLGREALARHEGRAERAEVVLASFKKTLAGLRGRLELDPVSVLPNDLDSVVQDLRGLIGSPLEWLRRVSRGQGVVSAFQRTFSLESRMEELEQALVGLREVSPDLYVERMEDHFRMVASSLARTYRGLVSREPSLFIEMECREELVEGLFDPHRAAVERGFTTYRDQTVGYLDGLREQMLGPSSRLERALATGIFLLLIVDLFLPGFSVVTYSAAYLLTRTLGSEFSGLLAEHRSLRARQRADLEAAWERLAQGLEDHFLRGDRYFGKMDLLETPEREQLREVLERLRSLDFPEGGGAS